MLQQNQLQKGACQILYKDENFSMLTRDYNDISSALSQTGENLFADWQVPMPHSLKTLT
jgi:hypothetical protein